MYPPDALRVPRSSALPSASFRFYLTVNTLAVQLTVPLIGSVEDFHLREVRPAGRTKKR